MQSPSRGRAYWFRQKEKFCLLICTNEKVRERPVEPFELGFFPLLHTVI